VLGVMEQRIALTSSNSCLVLSCAAAAQHTLFFTVFDQLLLRYT
jgi:hypothetical protein